MTSTFRYEIKSLKLEEMEVSEMEINGSEFAFRHEQPSVALDIRSLSPSQHLEGPTVPCVISDEDSTLHLGHQLQNPAGAPSLEGFDELPELPQLSAEEVRIELELLYIDFEGDIFRFSGMPPPTAETNRYYCQDSESSESLESEATDSPMTPFTSLEQSAATAASWILNRHDLVRRVLANERFKRKPMVHEFFGYILFADQFSSRNQILRNAAYFCKQDGERVDWKSPNLGFFKVSRFLDVAQVWKRIKSNASEDCVKNLKRAMRMSISNERNYFIDLGQSYHRQHIYQFGTRSLEFFQRVFHTGGFRNNSTLPVAPSGVPQH